MHYVNYNVIITFKEVIKLFTQNDYYILESILDKNDDSKGLIKTKGTTKKEIITKTNLSLSKVTLTLGMLESHGYIEVGLKVKNAKSYIVSEKGMEELLKMKGMYKDE